MSKDIKEIIILVFLLICLVTVYIGYYTGYKATISDPQTNTQNAIEWVTSHKKPIIVNIMYTNKATATKTYTLIDADGVIYNTGDVELMLTDTLR